MILMTAQEVAEYSSKALKKPVPLKTVYSWIYQGRKGFRLLSMKLGSAQMIPEKEINIFLGKAFKSIDRKSVV